MLPIVDVFSEINSSFWADEVGTLQALPTFSSNVQWDVQWVTGMLTAEVPSRQTGEPPKMSEQNPKPRTRVGRH